MTPDRWTRIDSIVQAALVRPAESREAFVNEACADDPTLANEVLSLLNEASVAGSFLEAGAASATTLEPDQTLGAYTIRELLGAGGMGEVYRAFDPRLRREVALKILPPQVARDPERLRRFQTEARAAAAITHPNIVTIYSVEQAGDLHFLTMELVDGTPLSQQIPNDGFDVERLLEIAVPLADAVAAAHAKGIVHRDLKPANVMVGSDGRIKVLDFGLAKLKPLGGLAGATTGNTPATIEGQLLGTVAYMSPEQAEGRDVDARSDVFSLGVMLFELATGNRPFTGDSSVSVLSSILKDAPPLVSAVKPQIPRELSRIVRRCLAKDPNRRYQSGLELRNDLEDVAAELASKNTTTLADQADSQRSRIGAVAWSAAALAIVVLATIGYLRWRGETSSSRPTEVFTGSAKIDVPLPASITEIYGLALSPDGTNLAFVAAGQLWKYELETRELKSLTTIGGGHPFWSPDGKFIAYFQDDPSRLMKIPATGGITETVCVLTPGRSGRGGAWAGGTIVFGEFRGPLFRVPAAGGPPVPVTTVDAANDEQGHYWPQFLPDAQRFVYFVHGSPSRLVLGSLNSGEPHRDIKPATHRAYFASGRLLTVQSDSGVTGVLRAQAFDVANGSAGESIPVSANVGNWSTLVGEMAFAAAGSVLAFASPSDSPSKQFMVTDARGRELDMIGTPVRMVARDVVGHTWSLSPDGRTIAFSQLAGSRYTIGLLDLVNGTLSGLGADMPAERFPIWSRTSDRIVFTKVESGVGQQLHVERVGDDSESAVGDLRARAKLAYDWHGRTLLFGMQNPTAYNIFSIDMVTGGPTRVWFPSPREHGAAQFSPHGDWVTYQVSDSNGNQIYVRRFPEGDGQRITAGSTPRWRADGKAIFYLEGAQPATTGVVMEVELEIGATVKPGTTRKVMTIGKNCGFAVRPDGGFVLCRPVEQPPQPPALTIVTNWTATLPKK